MAGGRKRRTRRKFSLDFPHSWLKLSCKHSVYCTGEAKTRERKKRRQDFGSGAERKARRRMTAEGKNRRSSFCRKFVNMASGKLLHKVVKLTGQRNLQQRRLKSEDFQPSPIGSGQLALSALCQSLIRSSQVDISSSTITLSGREMHGEEIKNRKGPDVERERAIYHQRSKRKNVF
jgi:hypothetical protein